jgi:hypothetical protein
MQSVFKEKMRKVAQTEMGFDPSVEVGVFQKTANIFADAIENNPWYLSINNMSPLDAALVPDSIKTGLSVTVRGKIDRKPFTHINPLGTDYIYGNGGGKASAYDLANNVIYAQMDLISQNTPTITGTHTIKGIKTSNVPAPVSPANSQISGTIGPPAPPTSPKPDDSGGFAPFNPFDPKIGAKIDSKPLSGSEIIKEEVKKAKLRFTPNFSGSVSKDIDPDTGEETETQYSAESMVGSDISTGAFLIDNSTLASMFDPSNSLMFSDSSPTWISL